jgi:hypothetical protein
MACLSDCWVPDLFLFENRELGKDRLGFQVVKEIPVIFPGKPFGRDFEKFPFPGVLLCGRPQNRVDSVFFRGCSSGKFLLWRATLFFSVLYVSRGGSLRRSLTMVQCVVMAADGVGTRELGIFVEVCCSVVGFVGVMICGVKRIFRRGLGC